MQKDIQPIDFATRSLPDDEKESGLTIKKVVRGLKKDFDAIDCSTLKVEQDAKKSTAL